MSSWHPSFRIHEAPLDTIETGSWARVPSVWGARLQRAAKKTYFLLRRWWRVLRSSLRCFFFAMRLRRFLMTEPTENLTKIGAWIPLTASGYVQTNALGESTLRLNRKRNADAHAPPDRPARPQPTSEIGRCRAFVTAVSGTR